MAAAFLHDSFIWGIIFVNAKHNLTYFQLVLEVKVQFIFPVDDVTRLTVGALLQLRWT